MQALRRVLPLDEGQLWRGRGPLEPTVPVFSSGSVALDGALALRGIPAGVLEIRGAPGTGGLGLAMTMCGHALRADPQALVAVVDTGHALHAPGVLEAGVPPGRLWCVRPPEPLRACPLALKFLRSGVFRVVVLDLCLEEHAPRQPELQVRRLGVAAQEAGSVLVLLSGEWARQTALPLPVATRLRPERHPGPAGWEWVVQVDKQRGASATPRISLFSPVDPPSLARPGNPE